LNSKKLTIYAIGFVMFIISGMQLNQKNWRNDKLIIYNDIISYYAYLPATFIYKDITLNFIDKGDGEGKYIFWPNITKDGKKVIKMSSGMSMMYAPFFFFGHLYALNSNTYEATGFSVPYRVALIIGSLVWLLIGLIFLRKVLLRYFPENIAALTILIVVLGTNLLHYSTREPTMSHLYNFSLFAIFLWLTIKWFEKPTVKWSILIGMLTGLITVTRPNNLIIVFIFMFYGVYHFKSLKDQLQLFWRQKWNILVIVFSATVLVLPQLFYWKYVTGQWVYYSYGENEKFFFNNPQIINGLFSYRKGWLLYTPVMTLALAGVFFLKEKLKNLFIPVLIFILLNIYITFSWWSWWYGGSFGMRPMIDSYSILALPLAAITQFFYHQKVWIKNTFLVALLLFALNGFWGNIKYFHGSIHWDSMTKAAYWDSFGRVKPSPDFYNLIKEPDYESAAKGLEEY
ncbi:MAG TPA: hypothetical protein PLU49_06625, partial [Saprospiraceae bacterium]|nr:hypothetical protein [Saprospiraceae bacterium]